MTIARNIVMNVGNFFLRTRPFWIAYRETDYQELKKLNAAFDTYIAQGVMNYPNLFEIDDKYKAPAAKEREITSCFNLDIKNNHGKLCSIATHIFNLVNTCYRERTSLQAGLYIDSPSNLFLAELSRFANDLSKKELNAQVLIEIKKRVTYLNEIEKNSIFQLELEQDSPIDLFIFNVRIYLENTVIPIIEAELSQECAEKDLRN